MGKDRDERRAAEKERKKALKKKSGISDAMSSLSVIDKRKQRKKHKEKGPTMSTKSAKEFKLGKAAAHSVLKLGGSLEKSIAAAQEFFAKNEGGSEVFLHRYHPH